jgi:hypothetical protein
LTFEEYCKENDIAGEDREDFREYLRDALSIDNLSDLDLSSSAFEEHYNSFVFDIEDDEDDF